MGSKDRGRGSGNGWMSGRGDSLEERLASKYDDIRNQARCESEK